jgi:hypothetical protein
MYPSKISQQRARELFGGEIQLSRFEKLLGFLDRFSETERREYVALLQANVSEKRPSTRYPKHKFHPTLEARIVRNFAEEQALGAGWRDRQYQPGEEQTPDEPLLEVQEILYKPRNQSLQELLDWLVLRACSIADSHEQARDLKLIPTLLIFSAVWLDHQAKAKNAQNAEEISAQYLRLSEVDLHTRIDYAKLRPELVDVLNVEKYIAALGDVERRNAPPPSLVELSLAAQERNNALLQELIEIQKRPSMPETPKRPPDPVTRPDDPPKPANDPFAHEDVRSSALTACLNEGRTIEQFCENVRVHRSDLNKWKKWRALAKVHSDKQRRIEEALAPYIRNPER